MLLAALVALPVALLPAIAGQPAPPPAAFDCAFDYGMQDWPGPRRVRVAFDFAAQRATVTPADGSRAWIYERRPGYTLTLATTPEGVPGAIGDGAEGFTDMLILDEANTLTWIQFTPRTESTTVWTCTPA